MSPRKTAIRSLNDACSAERDKWLRRAAFFHREDLHYLQFLIPEGLRVLELGCGTGHLLAALKPSFGVGVDFSSGMVAQARSKHPDLTFFMGDIEDEEFIASLPGPFDVILIADTIGLLDDCQGLFASLHTLCMRETRLMIAYFSHLWYPVLKGAEAAQLRMPQPSQNVLSPEDIRALVELADFEPVKAEKRLLSPARMLGVGRAMNRFVAPWPGIRSLCLRHYTVCRSLRHRGQDIESATVVVPARNERGNIEAVVTRLPRFGDIEIIFVEGHSNDGTWENRGTSQLNEFESQPVDC